MSAIAPPAVELAGSVEQEAELLHLSRGGPGSLGGSDEDGKLTEQTAGEGRSFGEPHRADDEAIAGGGGGAELAGVARLEQPAGVRVPLRKVPWKLLRSTRV